MGALRCFEERRILVGGDIGVSESPLLRLPVDNNDVLASGWIAEVMFGLVSRQ